MVRDPWETSAVVAVRPIESYKRSLFSRSRVARAHCLTEIWYGKYSKDSLLSG